MLRVSGRAKAGIHGRRAPGTFSTSLAKRSSLSKATTSAWRVTSQGALSPPAGNRATGHSARMRARTGNGSRLKSGLETSGRAISGQAVAIRLHHPAPEGRAGGERLDQEGAGFERGCAVRSGGGGEGEAVTGGEAAVAVDEDQAGERPLRLCLLGDRCQLV